MSELTLEEQLERLRRQVFRQNIFMLVLLGVNLFNFIPAASSADLELRAREFILADELGHESAKLSLTRSGQPSLSMRGAGGRTIVLGDSSSTDGTMFGLRIDEGKQSSLKLGILEPEKELPTQNPMGLVVTGENLQTINLALDSEHRRPNLLMGSRAQGFIDLGIWFVDQRPYLKLFESGKCRAAIFVPPQARAKCELMKPMETLESWSQ